MPLYGFGSRSAWGARTGTAPSRLRVNVLCPYRDLARFDYGERESQVECPLAEAILYVVISDPARRRSAMTPNDFRKLALSFPDTEERGHMNHPDFRVAGKIFATLGYPDKSWG